LRRPISRADERRVSADRVTFRQVVEEIYDLIGEIEG
jgi:hypothetical protein